MNIRFKQTAYFNSANFKEANFDSATFNYAVFSSATFQDVSFHSATFNYFADFSCSTFHKDVYFINTVFGKNSGYARYYVIESDVELPFLNRMAIQHYASQVDIDDYIREGKYFSKAKKDQIYWLKESYTSFESARFENFADFTEAYFLSDTNFKGSVFKEIGKFDKAFFLNVEEFGIADMNKEKGTICLEMEDAYFDRLKGGYI